MFDLISQIVRNLLNLNSNSNDNQTIKNSLQQSGSGGQSTKFVQFGNTYVHHPSDDSSTQTKTSTTTRSTLNSSTTCKTSTSTTTSYIV